MGNKESEMGSSVDEEWIISCRKEILGEGRESVRMSVMLTDD